MTHLKSYQKFALLLALAIGGCHHASAPDKGWSDDNYISLMETGSGMMDSNRVLAAIPFYEQSLARALQAGDAEAIEISSYNLAISQLRNNDSVSALKTIKRAQASLKQHGISQPSLRLALIQGVALNTQSKWQESKAVLVPCVAAKDSKIQVHAFYIQGLNDYALNQLSALQKDIHAISTTIGKNIVETENEEELKIRERILRGDYKAAEKEAEGLVTQRRINHEYPPMREALSLEANALEHLGNIKKAHDIRLQIIESQKASVL